MFPFRSLLSFAAIAACAVLLAGCETIGGGPVSAAAAPKPPMTHTRAAEQCWMETEKTEKSMDLDKRADIVDRCIDKKLKHG